MNQAEIEEATGDPTPGDARLSLGDLFSRLVLELRDWFEAEFALYRAQATRRALSAAVAGVLILAAVTLAQSALVALLIGMIMLLAPQMGTGFAILTVVGVTLSMGGLLAWLGVRRIQNIVDPDKPS